MHRKNRDSLLHPGTFVSPEDIQCQVFAVTDFQVFRHSYTFSYIPIPFCVGGDWTLGLQYLIPTFSSVSLFPSVLVQTPPSCKTQMVSEYSNQSTLHSCNFQVSIYTPSTLKIHISCNAISQHSPQHIHLTPWKVIAHHSPVGICELS